MVDKAVLVFYYIIFAFMLWQLFPVCMYVISHTMLYLTLVCLRSSGTLSSHTALNDKDDLELEVLV